MPERYASIPRRILSHHPSPPVTTSTPEQLAKERTGTRFSLQKMQTARDLTMQAVQLIAARIKPGMNEETAQQLAISVLTDMGMERLWHQAIVRFGSNTLKIYKDRIDPAQVLGENDLFFIDLGVVWEGHEGDAGDTFTVGNVPEMAACAKAARILWHQVSQYWRESGCTGAALYDYAEAATAAMGWKLNLDIKGHRIGDFPHAIYKAGNLGDFPACPNTGLWILEIQIVHPTAPFGAFYEDLLIE